MIGLNNGFEVIELMEDVAVDVFICWRILTLIYASKLKTCWQTSKRIISCIFPGAYTLWESINK
jgi:hypothetical protein